MVTPANGPLIIVESAAVVAAAQNIVQNYSEQNNALEQIKVNAQDRINTTDSRIKDLESQKTDLQSKIEDYRRQLKERQAKKIADTSSNRVISTANRTDATTRDKKPSCTIL